MDKLYESGNQAHNFFQKQDLLDWKRFPFQLLYLEVPYRCMVGIFKYKGDAFSVNRDQIEHLKMLVVCFVFCCYFTKITLL